MAGYKIINLENDKPVTIHTDKYRELKLHNSSNHKFFIVDEKGNNFPVHPADRIELNVSQISEIKLSPFKEKTMTVDILAINN